jgi:hypothetical protein
MLIAALDQLEWGPPEALTTVTRATVEGLCPACGLTFDEGDDIVLSRYGPRDNGYNYQAWTHETCPDRWTALARLVERYDDKMISKIQRHGRNRADCGHPVDEQPVYLVRQPMPLTTAGHSRWVCESCATQGGGAEVTT